jgi:hypothetical protein
MQVIEFGTQLTDFIVGAKKSREKRRMKEVKAVMLDEMGEEISKELCAKDSANLFFCRVQLSRCYL